MASEDGPLPSSRKRSAPVQALRNNGKKMRLDGIDSSPSEEPFADTDTQDDPDLGEDHTKPPTTISCLPNEVLHKIFDIVWEGDMKWLYGAEVSQMKKSDLGSLGVNHEFRETALPFFGKKTTLSASAENLRLLKSSIRPDMLATFQKLELKTNSPAIGDNANRYKLLVDSTDKWAGPGILTPFMLELKRYCFHVDLGRVRMRDLQIGSLFVLRGGAKINIPFDTLVTFQHFTDVPNLARGGNKDARYRLVRRWEIRFLANSPNVEVAREVLMTYLDTQGAHPYTFLLLPDRDLRCAKCFRKGLNVSSPATRVVCMRCGLAVYCSNKCRNQDEHRHKSNECAFAPWTIGKDFAGVGHINLGYKCQKMTTIWKNHVQQVVRTEQGIKTTEKTITI